MYDTIYDIIEITVNGQKVNPKDIVVKWRELDGKEYTGDIEKYVWNVAQCEVGIAEAGEDW